MRKLCYLFLLLLFFACKKDETGEGREAGLIKKITNSETNMHNNSDYVFVYDTDGRIHSINDTVYNYGADGRIHSSRYIEENNLRGYKYEKDIQKSYKWDAKGRILEIRVEKWLEKSTTPNGDVMGDNLKPYIEAYFYYTDNNSLPDSIGYGETNAQLKTFKVFSYEKGNILKEENISEVYYISDKQLVVERSVVGRIEYSYGESINHHIYPLYEKMGFLPKGLGYVASKHSPKASKEEQFVIQNVPNDYVLTKVIDKQIDYVYTLSPNGFPSTIRQDVTVDMGHGPTKGNTVFLNIYY